MIAHLIACTVVAGIAAAFTFLLRRRSAELRYSIFFAALLAFAIPTPLLTKAADRLLACFVVKPPATAAFAGFPVLPERLQWTVPTLSVHAGRWHFSSDLLWLVWAMVFAVSMGLWLRRLLRPVERVRAATANEIAALDRARAGMGLTGQVELLIAAADRVPGACGLLKPCVVLPDTLSYRLSEAELHAILTHELAHIARRDNLSAAIVRVIVSAFWFHPLLWWIERRMLAEREAACDERVLAQGAEAEDYVSAIVKVCQMSFSGGAAYAGVTGANLKRRMEHIVSAQSIRPPSRFLRAIPAVIVVLGVAGSYVRAQEPASPEPQAQTETASEQHTANDPVLQKAKDCFDLGRFQEAEKWYRTVYLQDPVDPRGLMGLVETYIAEKRPNDAVQLLQSEIVRQAGRRELRVALGNLYVRSEEYDKAIAEYQSLLDSAVDSKEQAALHFRLGETYRRKGDFEGAKREFATSADLGAIPMDANYVQALLQQALLLDGQGQRVQASAVYEMILRVQPDHPIALNNLAYLRAAAADSRTDLDQSLDMALKAHQKQPDSAEIDDTVGWIYMKMNRPGDAEGWLRDALKDEPGNASFHYHLGAALLQSGEAGSAMQELQTALAGNLSKDDRAAVQSLMNSR